MKRWHFVIFIVLILSLIFSLWITDRYHKESIAELKHQIEQKDKSLQQLLLEKEMLMERARQVERVIPRFERPLPVCSKGEVSTKCRQLAADESGATVRGARDDDQD